MKHTASPQITDVQVEKRGRVSSGEIAYARDKVRAVLDRAPKPVLFARVRVTRRANPAMDRPVIAQANLDVNGKPARAHVAGGSATEAADLLQDRLTAVLARMAEHWEARRGRTRPPGDARTWRHGDEPAHRPDYFPRPAAEREVVRHKSFALAFESPDEAADEMDRLDYDFHLFTDAGSGEDSVLYRSGPTGCRLAQVAPRPERIGPVAVPLTVSPAPAPRMSVAEARQRLEVTGWPFVFFADAATGRGAVLYHRYDGHYGLITPAADGPAAA
ncbi:sigma 54 modulation/S30EA ribosomal C-terminal domain-containing protein [Streptomyces sp. HNM0663]|uniref:Sigma 54 modulation/S30EA ribosomal C-terminal domain-containing protein n=1 Tax=Streptomyces chengmaiensis TaxID=3040919 RepID=A0ABT6HGM4_9ACTN|nr:sigma 54 modulation/S30EA ribosomal C-terminal domain-containing protein [Streptomyces chengmaiensis]MDH2387907.1 sigma 54 modulation/S30EA ribosomal C-terminal domain-containing protein [Streptomyces chengmaiensis]